MEFPPPCPDARARASSARRRTSSRDRTVSPAAATSDHILIGGLLWDGSRPRLTSHWRGSAVGRLARWVCGAVSPCFRPKEASSRQVTRTGAKTKVSYHFAALVTSLCWLAHGMLKPQDPRDSCLNAGPIGPVVPRPLGCLNTLPYLTSHLRLPESTLTHAVCMVSCMELVVSKPWPSCSLSL